MRAVNAEFEDNDKVFAIVTDDMGRRFRFLNVFHYNVFSSEDDYLSAAKRSFNNEGQRNFLQLIF